MQPSTMKAWQFSATKNGIEKNLIYNDAAAPPPTTTLSSEQVLVEVISMSLNPVDYKFPELPVAGRLMVGRPASPGLDYCGRVVSAGNGVELSQARSSLADLTCRPNLVQWVSILLLLELEPLRCRTGSIPIKLLLSEPLV